MKHLVEGESDIRIRTNNNLYLLKVRRLLHNNKRLKDDSYSLDKYLIIVVIGFKNF
jgi:hypothetical protein